MLYVVFKSVVYVICTCLSNNAWFGETQRMGLSALIVNWKVGVVFCTIIFPLCVKTFVSNQQFRRYLYANNLHEKRKAHLRVKALIYV